MKSNYDRKKFVFNYWLITGIFIIITSLIITFLGVGQTKIYKIFLALVVIFIILLAGILYLLVIKYMAKAYGAIEDISSNMEQFMKEEKISTNDHTFQDGDLGLLYDNFDKMIYMFQKKNERERDEKEYLKDVMSDISHQLKTPLASMKVFLELLINDKIDSESERRKILAETDNQVSRMEWMVLSMLKLARIEAGAITFDIRKSNLSLILDEVAGGVRYLLDTRGQKLIIDCPEDIDINVDPEWLIEALINIVKNASDYSSIIEEGNKDFSDKKKDIEIKVEQNMVFTRIYIEDHGIGMSEETMLHIFERFYRASNEVNPNSVGIGLSLSKSIIEGMGGKISVNSQVGMGSTFKVQL
ncbi:MAG: HAMP domain-containing histidine kinase [Eubacterium sp.]|nr:HAMP domain-containing histidine kinase [Eubacterium sp.]